MPRQLIPAPVRPESVLTGNLPIRNKLWHHLSVRDPVLSPAETCGLHLCSWHGVCIGRWNTVHKAGLVHTHLAWRDLLLNVGRRQHANLRYLVEVRAEILQL